LQSQKLIEALLDVVAGKLKAAEKSLKADEEAWRGMPQLQKVAKPCKTGALRYG